MSATESILEVFNVKHVFQNNRVLFEKVCFSLKLNTALFIRGENGTGKTTLLKILNGLIIPTFGEVFYYGKSITSISDKTHLRKIKKVIGWAPASDHAFFGRLTGLENLIYFGALFGIDKKSVISNVDRWKDILPLQDSLETPYNLCSTGMKQSLNICRAVQHKPTFLFLDEPFRGLSSNATKNLQYALLAESHTNFLVFTDHQIGFGDQTKTFAYRNKMMTLELNLSPTELTPYGNLKSI